MSGFRSPSVFTLQEAVGAAPSLAALQSQALASRQCLAQVLHLLPAGLRTQVLAGPLQDGEWCVLVRSPAAATKLRQLLPSMQRTLRESGAQVSAIRIKVQTPGR